jgi:hypothetical protein
MDFWSQEGGKPDLMGKQNSLFSWKESLPILGCLIDTG